MSGRRERLWTGVLHLPAQKTHTGSSEWRGPCSVGPDQGRVLLFRTSSRADSLLCVFKASLWALNLFELIFFFCKYLPSKQSACDDFVSVQIVTKKPNIPLFLLRYEKSSSTPSDLEAQCNSFLFFLVKQGIKIFLECVIFYKF